MVSKFLLLAFGIVSTVHAGVFEREIFERDDCNADNCLRALRASQYPTRLPLASQDCSRILAVTTTPATVTYTSYSTVSTTVTVTIPTTLVQTFHDTATSVNHNTASTQVSVTVTAIEASVLKKRATTVSTSLPAYASPCSGIVRYSSACQCIGVSSGSYGTVTAPTPSTTITQTVTETGSTSITQTVETTSVTITDTTIVQQTTDTTVTETFTSTVQPAAPTISGIARLYVDGVPQANYVGHFDSSGIAYAYVTADPGSAMVWSLYPDGTLHYTDADGTKVAKGNPTNNGANNLQFFFVLPEIAATTRSPYQCSLDANNFISCFMNPAQPLVLQWRTNNFIYSSSPANSQVAAGPVIQLKLL